jgi:hypothetical protein
MCCQGKLFFFALAIKHQKKTEKIAATLFCHFNTIKQAKKIVNVTSVAEFSSFHISHNKWLNLLATCSACSKPSPG